MKRYFNIGREFVKKDSSVMRVHFSVFLKLFYSTGLDLIPRIFWPNGYGSIEWNI